MFYWNDAAYACTTTSASRSKALTDDGFSPDADLVLFVRVDVFPGAFLPNPKEKIIYNTQTFRIDSVVTLPGNGQVKLLCSDVNRRS